jgi:phosphoesterase RecJ-like protein
MINFNNLKNIFDSNNSFLLTTHVNPDADAIGSEIALFQILNRKGKSVKIINHSSTPYNLQFLDESNIIEKFNSVEHQSLISTVDVLVALDFNRADRMVSMQNDFIKSKSIKICIDHHQDPSNFVDHQFIDSEYSATAHIIHEFIKKKNYTDLIKDIALPIYAAILTDTGSFRFERTNAELHRTIAELIECGVDPGEVYDKIYDESKLSKIKLLGRALDSLKFIGNGKIGYMVIEQETFKDLNAIESDTENFVNYTLTVENVVLGLLFIELNEGFKVSFRSKGKLPVNKLAGEFGGGGHINAAGARFKNSKMEILIPEILEKAEKYLQNYT